MIKSKTNKTLGEVLIGEAALALLDEKTPVSWSGILKKLESKLSDEKDELRAEVLKTAIQDVNAEMERRAGAEKSDESQGNESAENQNRLTRH